MAKRNPNNIVSHLDILKNQGQSNYLKEREKPTGSEAYLSWLAKVNATLRWRKAYWNGDGNWKRAYKLYGGKHWKFQDEDQPSADESRDLITVNITMSTINNLVPFLINNNPFYALKPRKPSDDVSARLQQEILNYEFQLQQMIVPIKEAVLDAAIIGHGIIKSGFTFDVDQAVTQQAGEIVYEDYIRAETPYLTRVDPFCFIFDPAASQRNLETARWCGEIFYRYYEDVLENESYDSSVRNKIKSGEYSVKMMTEEVDYGVTPEDSFIGSPEFEGEYRPKIVKLFEIWDKKYKKYFVFADGVEEPLIEKDWPYDYLQGFPYRRLDFIRIPNSHYPVGIPYSIEDQQLELDRKRTEMFQHGRRFNRKYEILNKLSEKSKKALQDGEDGTLVEVEIMGSVNPIEDAPIPQDVWQIEAIIKQDILELSGLDSLIRGGSLPSRTTGTEVNTRTTLFRMKIDDLVERTDRFVLNVGKDILAHIKANMMKSRVVRVLGLQGEFWVNVLPQDIKEEVDVQMESVAAPKRSIDMEIQQGLQLLQLSMQVIPLMQQLGQPLNINLPEMFAWVVEKFGYKDVGRFFQRALVPTPPLQEMGSNSLNGGQNGNSIVPNVQGTSRQPMSTADLQNQSGLGSIMNASGLQFGG